MNHAVAGTISKLENQGYFVDGLCSGYILRDNGNGTWTVVPKN